MKQMKSALALLGLLGVLGWSSASAVTFDLTTTSISSNIGTANSGGLSVAITAYSFLGKDYNNPASGADLHLYSGGLGVTNDNEPDSSPQHTIDNNGSLDYIKLAFSQAVNISSISNGWFSGDADLSYGTSISDPNALTTVLWNGSSYGAFTLDDFSDVWYISASVDGRRSDGSNDYFKVSQIEVSAVPIPAAAWLFGSALMGMVGLGYRRKSMSV